MARLPAILSAVLSAVALAKAEASAKAEALAEGEASAKEGRPGVKPALSKYGARSEQRVASRQSCYPKATYVPLSSFPPSLSPSVPPPSALCLRASI